VTFAAPVLPEGLLVWWMWLERPVNNRERMEGDRDRTGDIQLGKLLSRSKLLRTISTYMRFRAGKAPFPALTVH